ncbi:hypothetical protein HDE_13378 [Halotydeus destructor]|nr:hypothetical protein HDE_13378 [Halotydeus destructor]
MYHRILHTVTLLLVIVKSILSVTVHEVRILSDSGKSDYVLTGEGVVFSCLFVIDPDEVIQSVIWEKDKEQVYVLRKDSTKPVALGVLEGHVDLTNESPSTIEIKNVTIGMQGSYSCKVLTQRSKSQNEAFLNVIQDACQESSWETHTDMVSCTEDITFYCRGMFPKPSPVCGIYNDLTGSYILSIPFDRTEKMGDGTYEISLFRRLHAKDWLDYPGQLSFRCYIIVMSTTWRRGIHHKLFGDSGCPSTPLALPHGHYNVTSTGSTCWRTPKQGSVVNYACDADHDMLGPDTFICRDGQWLVVQELRRSTSTTERPSARQAHQLPVRIKPPQKPYCNSSQNHLVSTVAVMVMLYLFVTR